MNNKGKIFVVGNGPGDLSMMVPKAAQAIQMATFICGYAPYVEQIKDLIPESATVFSNKMKGEIARVKVAVQACNDGETVALVCGGDASLYSMASLVHELTDDLSMVEVIPGITAALAASGKLGAPISDDLALISMSDLLTPWEVIKKRIDAINIGDFVCAIYNPKSKKRVTQLPYAIEQFISERGDLACGWVKNCDRDDEEIEVTTLKALDLDKIGMSTILIIGNSRTQIKQGKLVSPRGYTEKYGV